MFSLEVLFILMLRIWEQIDQERQDLAVDCGGPSGASPEFWNKVTPSMQTSPVVFPGTSVCQ
jgi:hypothetical protein